VIVWLQVALVAVALLAVHRPGGDYLARAFTGGSYLRVERFVYRVCRVDPDADQPAAHYVTSLLAFSVVSVHLLLRVQHLPPAAGRPKMPPDQAFNTAVSFHTNTSWQSYAGESALGHLAQAAGIGVAAFVSAAVGLAVALALTRGFARDATDRLGNFYVDLVRGCVRVLLPLSVGGAIALAALGVVQNLASEQTVSTLGGGVQHLPGGPVASFEPIKLISGDGGGFFGANSAHPFENPNGASNLLQILLMLVIPVCVPRMFGRMVGDLRQGWAVFAVMALLWLSAVGLATAAEVSATGSPPGAAGAALEGKEVRFGPASSALFAVAGTSTRTARSTPPTTRSRRPGAECCSPACCSAR
jgi:K+-transporting ATPase ATPase A chain